jgi:organic hydroperoxide reductase OsmC/OhrA
MRRCVLRNTGPVFLGHDSQPVRRRRLNCASGGHPKQIQRDPKTMFHVAMGQKEREMEMDYNYRVRGSWEVRRNGVVSAEGITEPKITFSAPVEFKGESGHWTPEHFLVAAVVSCFIVTFSAMAESSRLNFLSLGVSARRTTTKSRRQTCLRGDPHASCANPSCE